MVMWTDQVSPYRGAFRTGEVMIPAIFGDLQERVPPNTNPSGYKFIRT